MSEYKRKLRSAKEDPTPQDSFTEDNTKDTSFSKPACPKTPPPIQSIEPYFPPSPFGRKRHQFHGDRFIPTRERSLARDYQMSATAAAKSGKDNAVEPSGMSSGETRRFSAYFRAEILNDETALDDYNAESPRSYRRVLQYSKPVENTHNYTDYTSPMEAPILSPSSPPPPPSSLSSSADILSPNSSKFQILPIGEAGRRILMKADRNNRHINTTAIKILDAPELQDDFYLNLVDWGANDCLAVGLGSCVYLWNANTSRVTKLLDLVTDNVTSVSWSPVGSLLSVGTNSGKALLYDADHSRRIRTWSTHSSRIGAMAWKSNILTTGGRDHAIYHHDVRSSDPHFRKLTGHTQEICGLKWNNEGTMLASGGNDNNLFVWDSHENAQAHRFSQHVAAVKAISWSPHKRGVLVSGGGTADKTIKFWNTITGSLTSSHDTGSQVCNIGWSKKSDDIVSTHGYSSNAVTSSNQVIVWKADQMQKIATLTGHTCRVLYMAMSNDGSTVVTGAGDETLRFWDIFSSLEPSRSEERRPCIR
ncbi:hypothetical protein INT47_006057 [Mucor saturninus]|uniref:CDC20/Fizzy WD40 domain-containing protein n=1 Tax=Mucor saturninus TaxID=64648 RepID=A0A8H7USC5_9FUNG|nr:hypothetical protein INT47_006057 [Mucor saturninus]